MSVRRILHLSDLHLGPPFLPDVAEAALAAATGLAPDLVVVSGDLTQRAKRGQFEGARRFLDRLPDVPRVVVPGNHDVPLWRAWERLVRPLGLYREHVAAELDGVLRLEGATVVWLDSTAPRRAISNGRIDPGQLDLCSRAFEAVPPDDLRIVVTHHHFLRAPDFERDRAMPRARRALERLVALRVDMILGGHLHRAYIGHTLDVWAGADREHGTVIVQCGTTTSRRGRGREREKNTFNLVEVDPAGDRFTITHFAHFAESGGFEPISRHEFPRPSRRSLA